MNAVAQTLASLMHRGGRATARHLQKSRDADSSVQRQAQKNGCACGGGCPKCQTKKNGLKISQPGDASEIEADQVADKIMRMSSPVLTPSASNENHANTVVSKSSSSMDGNKTFSRKALPSNSSSPSQTPAHIDNALSSGGQGLDRKTRNFFEPRLGYDLSGVRIHTNATARQSAQAVDARAYTLGSNIVFAENEYQPDSRSGKQLLAHELAHVVQQHNSNEKIHRAARGAAGGCGICMNDPGGKEAGKIAHAEIQMAFAAGNPDIVAEYAIPVVEPGAIPPFVPEIDLSYVTHTKSQKTISIGEIKPLDDAGKQVGIAREKLKDYARELKANTSLQFDEVIRMTDSPPAGPIPFFNPSHPPGCPPQMIYVQMTEPGIYQYYCEPPFSTLVKNPLCKCKKKEEDEEKKDKKVIEVEKPKVEVKNKQDEKNDKKKEPETGLPPYVVPAAIGAGVSVAAAAYLRKKAIEQAEKRAAQLAWRKMAEAAAARRIAAATAKNAAGKTIGKVAVYAEIAAAAALILLYPERVEAKPGMGPSPIESLYKAMTTNGSPPSPEMKALIESDPILKQLAEEAGSSGDGSKLQEEMALRTLEMIKNNPDIFTPEDLEFLSEFSKTAQTAQAPKTAEELRQAIDAAKAGKTGSASNSKGIGDDKSTAKTDTPPTTKPDGDKPGGSTQGDAAQPDGKSNTGDKAMDGGTPQADNTTAPGQDDPKFKKLNDESRKQITEAPPQVSKLFKEFASGQKDDLKLDDEIVKKFFDVVPKDLTDKQVETLIDGLTSSQGKTIDEAIQLLKTAIEQVKKSDTAKEAGGENTGTPSTPTTTDSPPAKTKDQIIAELAAIAKRWDFSSIPNGKVKIQDGTKKVTGNQLNTYVYGKVNGVGIVGYISGTIPNGIDVSKLKKGDTFTVTITSQSPFVDKDGKVHEFKMGSKFTMGK
jgi:hypothetical protein